MSSTATAAVARRPNARVTLHGRRGRAVGSNGAAVAGGVTPASLPGARSSGVLPVGGVLGHGGTPRDAALERLPRRPVAGKAPPRVAPGGRVDPVEQRRGVHLAGRRRGREQPFERGTQLAGAPV